MTVCISKIKVFHNDGENLEYVGKTVPYTPSLIGMFLINQNYSMLSDDEKQAVSDGQILQIKPIMINRARRWV